MGGAAGGSMYHVMEGRCGTVTFASPPSAGRAFGRRPTEGFE